jgi:hypothetical protein
MTVAWAFAMIRCLSLKEISTYRISHYKVTVSDFIPHHITRKVLRTYLPTTLDYTLPGY